MPNVDDPYDLQRFVDAQDRVYDDVCAELGGGRKQTHWMWFIFPQIAGLGHSPMARRFAISSVAEAEAYLNHKMLGPRLRECTGLITRVEGRSAREILGQPDDMKLRSCLTLFIHATSDSQVFRSALEKYFDGEEDKATLARL
jgi:uncharacterized protein (DUF1810 family)